LALMDPETDYREMIAPATKGIGAIVDSDLTFNTGKHFGCIHHEKK